MEKPNFPNSITPQQKPTLKKPTKQKIKFPTPQELITHYESQGMTSQEASIKVIDDLQHVLFRFVKGKKDSESTRKLDSVNARLAIIEKKIDSKPGFMFSVSVSGRLVFLRVFLRFGGMLLAVLLVFGILLRVLRSRKTVLR